MNRIGYRNELNPQEEFRRTALFASDVVCLADVRCRGVCRHRSAEENNSDAQLIFPYRGLFIRHVGSDESVADANQVLFFGADEMHQVSHPITGGDACVVMTLSQNVLPELASAEIYDEKMRRFRVRSRSLLPAAQALRTVLLTRLADGVSTALEAESISLALARLAFAPMPLTRYKPTRAKRHLVDRVKLFLADSASKRISLADIGESVGASPVYLTQVFSELEGLPLYRYQLRLRLAQALVRLPDQKDLSALALDLGFSSHSQFTTLFGQTFGLPPGDFLRTASLSEINRLLKILKAGPLPA
ncbi:MAG: helix-turn-helix transcriptional regulator [Arenimonas sp.]